MAENERASFGFYPQLRRNRTVQDPEAAKNAPLAALRGFISGVAGAPGDIESLARIPYDYLRSPTTSELVTGDKKSKTFFPTSEEIEAKIPLRGTSPVEKAFAGAGQLGGGFYYGRGSPLRVLAESPQILKKAGMDFAQSIAPVNVIKPTGGNWVVEPKMGNLYNRAGYAPNLKDTLAELQARYTPEAMAKLSEEGRNTVNMGFKDLTERIAMDKWLDSNMKNYIKNEMGTPEDPIRLLIEKRETEILGKFEKDRERAQRMASRAEAEPDPRRKANMTRQAQQMLDEAEAEKALALQHKSHLPPDLQTPESMWTPEDLASARKEEGFPEEGIGKTNASQLWEQMVDESIYPTKAGEIQRFPEEARKRAEAVNNFHTYEERMDDRLVPLLMEKGLTSNDIADMLKLPSHTKAGMLGEAKVHEDLFRAIPPYNSNNQFLEYASNTSPWISKVDPNTSVYSGDVSGLNFDHVIDVIKEDLAAGRLKPEKLNTLSIEQAVRRTADYDLELAKKMNAERASSRANLPVYKEYPDEGLKWVQLNRPSDFAAESEAMGHSVRGYEPPEGHPDWVKGSGESGYNQYGLGGWEAIKSGKAKVYSLVDSKGQPHVTIEIGKKQKSPTLKDMEKYFSAAQAEAKQLPQGYTDSDVYDIAKRMAQENEPEFINQIKGKGNAKPKDAYLPFVQDFVRSQNWSEVRDFKNTGFDWQLTGPNGIFDAQDVKQLEQAGYTAPKYLTTPEKDDLIRKLYELQTGKDFGTGLPKQPPAEGMKRGGPVTLEDLAMNYYVPDYNEDDYYEMPMALMPPQQRMSKGGLTQYKECNCHG
jgi:hypothetical protein